MKHLAIILWLVLPVSAQQFPPVSAAARSVALRGTVLPATCTPPQIFLRTGATAPGVYGCTAANTWVGPAGVGGTMVWPGAGIAVSSGADSWGTSLQTGTVSGTIPVRGAGGSIVGAVSSVGLTAPPQFAVTGSPVTASGTLGLGWNTQVANSVLAGPTSGGAVVPTFRALVNADLPATVVYTTGSFSDPAWITALSGAKITGAVATATALAANGTNCASNQAATGVDALGNAEGCWTPAGGGGSSIEISNNANTLVGVASRLQLANGTGIAWSFVDEGSGRIRSTPTLDPGSVMLTTGQQTRSPGLTAEQLSSGTSYVSKRRANAPTTGTTVNRLARIDSAGNAVLSASTDTGIPLWIVMAGAGTTGSAELLTEGRGLLQMVGACTRGQFVVQSSSAGQGLCTATPSDGAFVLAMADDTGGGAGLYAVVALSPFRWGGAGGATVVRQFGAHFNSPAVAQVQYFRVPQACTITGWQIIADGGTTPTATFDVWMIAAGTALPTVANTITASAKPALATGRAVDSSTLTGWTTAAANRAIGAVRIDALSGSPTSIQLSVYCQ